MARMHHWIGFSLLSLSLVGCVSQDKYNALRIQNDDLNARLAVAESEASSASAQSAAYQNQSKMGATNSAAEQAMITNLNSQISTLQSENADLTKRYEDMLKNPPQTAVLPTQLTNALSAFASENPNLVDFDAARGIVKFRSDVTFAPGSAELAPGARDIISKFATILNSSVASGYELMVAGHTDSTPVVNPATIRAGNKDNWFLSAHRAIAVEAALQAEHVSAGRMGIEAYADERPVASNSTEQGKAMNRRVEIMLLPTSTNSHSTITSATPTPRPVPAPAAHPAPLEKNKDTIGSTDMVPLHNK